MTQQPYPPQYPGQPQQPYAPQPPAQYAPQPQVQYPPQQAYPQQPGYPPAAPYGQPAPAPQVPLATGSLDDFFNQPGAGTGPSLSWKDKPVGTSYAGIVARDVAQADIQQETDPTTNAPKFFKDGRPKFVMKVPLKVQPSPEFPEGEATFYVRGQGRDELVRAMTEAGATSNVPRGGDMMAVTLVQRRPSRMGNPANIVQIRYGLAQGGAQQAPQQAAAPAPAPQVEQPAPVQQVEQVQQYAPQPVGQQQFPQVPEAQFQAPQVQQPVQQYAPQPVQQQPTQQAAPQPPAGLDAEQQALLAQLTGGAPTQGAA